MSRYANGFRDGFREGYKAGEQGLFKDYRYWQLVTTWRSHLDDEYSTDDDNHCLLKNNEADWSESKHYVVTKITTIKKCKHKKKLHKP